jgi:hypothetical protein
LTSATKTYIPWIDRGLAHNPFSVGLCQSESKFKRELLRLKVPIRDWPIWLRNTAAACVHEFISHNGDRVCIVCIDADDHTPAQLAGIMAHEATHIWQKIAADWSHNDLLGEFAAYAVENLTEDLFKAYRRPVMAKKKGGKKKGCK